MYNLIQMGEKFGQDPRKQFRNHRERGPKKYIYTVKTIAEFTELAVSTVRAYSLRGLKLDDLASVSAFVQRYIVKRAARRARDLDRGPRGPAEQGL